MKQYLSLSILFDLYKQERISAKKLADKYEISPKSVYRYVSELESAGVPTFSKQGKNGGIGIEKNFKVESLFLSSKEKDYLKSALNVLPEEIKTSLIKKLSL